MRFLIVPDALEIRFVGEDKSCTHEAGICGDNWRTRHFQYAVFPVASAVVEHQSANCGLTCERWSQSLLDIGVRTGVRTGVGSGDIIFRAHRRIAKKISGR